MKRLFLILFLFASSAFAADVTVAWDAPSGPVPDGYKIHVGTAAGVYGTPVDVGNVTQYTVTGLLPGNTYYMVASAYKSGYTDSGYSNEISKGFLGNPGGLRIIAALIVDKDGNVKMRYLTPEEYAAIFFRAA
jgi:hypothetical protein